MIKIAIYINIANKLLSGFVLCDFIHLIAMGVVETPKP